MRRDNSLIDYLSIDGETWPKITQLPHIFIVLKEIITFLSREFPNKSSYYLWNARINVI